MFHSCSTSSHFPSSSRSTCHALSICSRRVAVPTFVPVPDLSLDPRPSVVPRVSQGSNFRFHCVFPTVPIPKSSVCARLIAHLSVNLGANCFLFLPRKKRCHFRPLCSRNTLSHHPPPFHSPRGESILFSFRPDVILNSAVC